MKFIQQTVEYIPSTYQVTNEGGINNLIENKEEILKSIYKDIEIAGRVCYQSENKIGDNTCYDFVYMLKVRGHYTPMSFGRCYLIFNSDDENYNNIMKFFTHNPYSRTKEVSKIDAFGFKNSSLYVSTNYQVLYEMDKYYSSDEGKGKYFNINEMIKYLVKPDFRYHTKIFTYKIISERVIIDSLRTHGTMRFCVESTRFCNYEKEKFGKELTYIYPIEIFTKDIIDKLNNDNELLNKIYSESMLKFNEGKELSEEEKCSIFLKSAIQDEKSYMCLTSNGMPAQSARRILPLGVKSTMFITAFEDQWPHFFDLRSDEKSNHPQIIPIVKDMQKIFNMNKN